MATETKVKTTKAEVKTKKMVPGGAVVSTKTTTEVGCVKSIWGSKRGKCK